MGAKRRNGVEIGRDILRVCVQGANKTRIVYRANLNSGRLNSYLDVYVAMGMLAKEKDGGGNVVYKTTLQGIHFLDSYFWKKNAVSACNGKNGA